MRFLEWLFDRGATCERLREDCALAERQAGILAEENRRISDVHAQTMMREASAKRDLDELRVEIAATESAMDMLDRRLWREGRLNEELREKLAGTEANARCCFAAMELQMRALRQAVTFLTEESAMERQGRIEAQAELETLKAKVAKGFEQEGAEAKKEGGKL